MKEKTPLGCIVSVMKYSLLFPKVIGVNSIMGLNSSPSVFTILTVSIPLECVLVPIISRSLPFWLIVVTQNALLISSIGISRLSFMMIESESKVLGFSVYRILLPAVANAGS